MKIFLTFLFSISFLSTSFVLAQDDSTNGIYSISSFDQVPLANLSSPACYQVYIANVTTCTMQDFLPTIPCSTACVQGLKGIQLEAQAMCATVKLNATSVLSSFVSGQAVAMLCTTEKSQSCGPSAAAAQQKGAAPLTGSDGSSSDTSTAEIISGGGSMQLSHGGTIALVIFLIFAITFLLIAGWTLMKRRKAKAAKK
jgi:hypothetical protein